MSKQGLRLETGQQVRLDVALELGVVTESVTVTSGAPALNLERGAIKGDVILYEELQDLPLLGTRLHRTGVLDSRSGAQGARGRLVCIDQWCPR